MKSIMLGLLCASVCALTTMAEDQACKCDTKGAHKKGSHFEAMDKDGNGSLSLEEYKVMYEKRAAAHKKAKGDQEEAKPFPSLKDSFAKLDADGDGAISKEELKAKGKKKDAAPKNK